MEPSTDATADPPDEQHALLQATAALLSPLAELLVARGVHFAAVEEQLRTAMVVAAREAALRTTPQAQPHRLVSRIATATGINRREVTRLIQAETPGGGARRGPALRAYTRWLVDPEFRDAGGEPLPLPRQGAAPSFEALAASITRDVHARSLLDDLLRLKLATWDEATDTVHAVPDGFVPSDSMVRMLGYLGTNVGDHLRAAVHNVIGGDVRHLEQAINATGLSEPSLRQLRLRMQQEWKQLVERVVPEIQALIDHDAALLPEPDGRTRIGMFMYDDRQPAQRAAPEEGDT